jgi:hypothetical protein
MTTFEYANYLDDEKKIFLEPFEASIHIGSCEEIEITFFSNDDKPVQVNMSTCDEGVLFWAGTPNASGYCYKFLTK